jgi:16S rRNA G966 N2-methylase RsmD
MAIRTINKLDYQQNLSTQQDKKEKYGEIFTPFSLIKEMFDMLSAKVFTNPNTKWLDAGAGTGFFSMFLFWKLDIGLASAIPERNERQDHIIKNMLYMIEIQEENALILHNLFGKQANIICDDFTRYTGTTSFDYVIGNPPYNSNGTKKVPTNGSKSKKQDGNTVWIQFVKKSISLLNPGGNLLVIIPSIWMKPDKAQTYNYLTYYNIKRLRCLTNTETNRIFSSQAQTPTCYFWLVNEPTDNQITLYDRNRNTYVEYPLRPHAPIPVFGAALISKLIPFVNALGHIRVEKTNIPRKGTSLVSTPDSAHPFPNIKTAVLEGLSPQLVVNYSNKPLNHHGVCKLVLPHKMYGFPYIDASGTYGISNRDNYVISGRSLDELEMLCELFSTKTALYLFEATRYRMKYLERYAFELIPDLYQLEDELARPITDETLASLFGFDTEDINSINTLHRKDYDFTYKDA